MHGCERAARQAWAVNSRCLLWPLPDLAPPWAYIRYDPKPTDGANPSKRQDSGFEPEVVKLLHGYAIEAVKIPLSDRWQPRPATSARC